MRRLRNVHPASAHRRPPATRIHLNLPRSTNATEAVQSARLTASRRLGSLTTRRSNSGARQMIKSEMVDVIAEKNPHLYRRDVERVVDAILLEIVQVMRQGGRAELRGFGTFSVKQRQARKGRNPRDGTDVEVGAKRAPYFKAGKEMRERLNAPADSRLLYPPADARGLGNSGDALFDAQLLASRVSPDPVGEERGKDDRATDQSRDGG